MTEENTNPSCEYPEIANANTTSNMKKRPMGLGAKGANKVSKMEQPQEGLEDAGEQETMFQLPEGELSEEAEIKTIFMAAEAAYNDFRALNDEELAEDAGKAEDEQIKQRAVKLYAGVVHECDRLLQLHDLGQHASLSFDIFELMGDALFKLCCLSKNDLAEISTDDEYLLAALEKFEAGLEEFPESVDLLVSKVIISFCQAILGEDADSRLAVLNSLAESLPSLAPADFQKNLHKMWQSLGEFAGLLEEESECLELISNLCVTIVPEDAELSLDERLQLASWQAKAVEAAMGKNAIEIAAVEEGLAKLEAMLAAVRDVNDAEPETQITFWELNSQLYLLRGSKHGLQGNEEAEQACYLEALQVFREMRANLGTPIPEFILDLITSQDEEEHDN